MNIGNRIIFIWLASFMTLCAQATTYDIWAKYAVPEKWQLQDFAWNDETGVMLLTHDTGGSSNFVNVMSSNRDGFGNTGQIAPRKQGFDIANNKAFFAMSISSINTYSTECLTCLSPLSSTPSSVINVSLSPSHIHIPQGASIVSWSGVYSAVDDGDWIRGGNTVVVARPNIEGSSSLGYQYYHAFIFPYAESGTINSSNSFVFSIPTGFAVQGVEVSNEKVYLSISKAGYVGYDFDYTLEVREYSLDGIKTGQLSLNADELLDTGSNEDFYSDYLELEHEGLSVIGGKVYAGLWYKYGWTEKTYKHLIYETFDSSIEAGGNWLSLRNRAGGTCLNAYGYDGAKSDNVRLFSCQGLPDQNWSFPPVGTWGEIKNRTKELCLNPEGTSGSSEANVYLWDCDGYDDQQWMLLSDGRIVNKAQGLCLNPKGTAGANRANVQIYKCDSNSDQQWDKTISSDSIVYQESWVDNNQSHKDGWRYLKNLAGDTCLNSRGYGGNLEDNVTVLTCEGLPDQTWLLPPIGTWGEIKNLVNGLCLNPKGTSGSKGENVYLWNCDGYVDQQWMLMPDGTIKNKGKGYCLNPKGTTGTPNSNVYLWTCDNEDDQKWTLTEITN